MVYDQMQPSNDTTFATVLTPGGRGAVAVVFIEGPYATAAVEHFFRAASGRPLSDFPIKALAFGRWDPEHGGGEEVVACRKSETSVEVNCHGGRAASEAILQSLQATGVVRSDALAWRSRNVPHGDVYQMLSDARTERAAAIVLDQLRGALSNAASEMISLAERQESAELLS